MMFLALEKRSHDYNDRMYLDLEQVKWLIGYLQKWVDTGEFD